MNTTDRVSMIRERLQQALAPESIEIEDDSHKHAGHAGAKSGGGHFNVRVISRQFEGKKLLERHRMVYDAMGDAMQNEIHALSIVAKSPKEL